MFDYDRMCLPKSGVFATANGAQQGYYIKDGMYYSTFNFKYDENGYGHALHFSGDQKEAAKRALEFLAKVPDTDKVEGIYETGYKDNFPTMKGQYALLDLPLDPHRPKLTKKVILFISSAGATFQVYHANTAKTDEEVLAIFVKLGEEQAKRVAEAERKAREKANEPKYRELLKTSGHMYGLLPTD